MKQDKKILENTVDGAAPNIATTDENLTVEDIYGQLDVPSIGKQIFHNYTQEGPTAAIFTLNRKSNSHLEILRTEAICYDSDPINTGITKETISDIETQFGLDARRIVAKMLKGLANEQENEKTKEFLEANAVSSGTLTLTNGENSKVIVEEIAQAVAEAINEINASRLITYKASAVLPAKYASSFSIRNKDFFELDGYLAGRQAHVNYYVDPDVTNTDTIYVTLHDADKSGGFFSSYTNDIFFVVDPVTGAENAFIYNRFAITASPAHTINPRIKKITIA